MKYGYFVSSRGGWISRRERDRLGDRGVVLLARDQASARACGASTSSRRFLAATGWAIGSKALGEATTPAISAASCGSSWAAQGRARSVLAARVLAAEVGARGGLDAVGAVAEVDRVEVVAQDLLLRPLARDVVRQRGLAQLHEQRPPVLGGERVLDELLGDRRAALDRLLGQDVLVERAADAAEVDAVVGVEALVLDRDDRVLHHRRDLALLEQDPLLVAGQAAERLAAAVDDHRVRSPTAPPAAGRSEATAIIIPNTVETIASRPRPASSAKHAQLADAQRDARRLVAVGVLRAQRDDPRLAVFGDGGRVGGALRSPYEGAAGPRVPPHALACGRAATLALGRMAETAPEAARTAAHLARNAVDCLPERRAREAPRRRPAAAGQARPRPDRRRRPPRPHGRAPEAARVPGPRPHRRPDHRRLHRARGRSERPLGDPAGALRRGDRRQRAHVRGAGGARAAHRRAARDPPQLRVAGHEHGVAVRPRAPRDRGAAARARRLRQALRRPPADLAARAALPGAPGLRLGGGATPTSSSAAPTRPSTC